jgi:hypothetical protein
MLGYGTLLAAWAAAFRAKIEQGAPRKRRRGTHPRLPKGARYDARRIFAATLSSGRRALIDLNRHGAPGSRLRRATGPDSYDAWKAELAAERAAKRLPPLPGILIQGPYHDDSI